MAETLISNPVNASDNIVDMHMAWRNLFALLQNICMLHTVSEPGLIDEAYHIPNGIYEYINEGMEEPYSREGRETYGRFVGITKMDLQLMGKRTLKKIVAYEIKPNFRKSVPKAFKCAISKNIMREPVIMSDGHAYDEEELINWWYAFDGPTKTKHVSKVVQGCVLSERGLYSFQLRQAIIRWVENVAHGKVVYEGDDTRQTRAFSKRMRARDFF